MSVFLTCALILTALAVLATLWPLWSRSQQRDDSQVRTSANVALYREHLAEIERDFAAGRLNQDTYQRLVAETQRNLLADDAAVRSSGLAGRRGRWALGVTALALVLGAAWLYIGQGNAPDVYLAERQQALIQADLADFEQQVNPGPGRTRELIALIEGRLKARPDNPQYWYLLARYTTALGDLTRARDALWQVYRLEPGDSNNTAQLAQALFLTNGNQITDEIRRLTQESLAVDPEEQTALGLAGIAAFQDKNFSAAIDYWRRAAAQLPEGSDARRALLAGIGRAEENLGAGSTGAAAETSTEISTETSPQASPAWQLPVTVSVKAGLDIPVGASLFVFLREAGGSPMPILATRQSASDFPVAIILNEYMAMTTKDRLHQAKQVEIVARLSQSGSVAVTQGDLEGMQGPYAMDALPQEIDLVLSQILSGESPETP